MKYNLIKEPEKLFTFTPKGTFKRLYAFECLLKCLEKDSEVKDLPMCIVQWLELADEVFEEKGYSKFLANISEAAL